MHAKTHGKQRKKATQKSNKQEAEAGKALTGNNEKKEKHSKKIQKQINQKVRKNFLRGLAILPNWCNWKNIRQQLFEFSVVSQVT